MTKLPDHHPHENEAALSRLVALYDQAHMSDAKWVRLLDGLCGENQLVLECHAKLVWDDAPRSFAISEDRAYGHDYYDTAVEAMIGGHPTGWYQYREVEWIEFPRRATVLVNPDNRAAGSQPVAQDLVAIRERIAAIGRFVLTETPEGLRLHAYQGRGR